MKHVLASSVQSLLGLGTVVASPKSKSFKVSLLSDRSDPYVVLEIPTKQHTEDRS